MRLGQLPLLPQLARQRQRVMTPLQAVKQRADLQEHQVPPALCFLQMMWRCWLCQSALGLMLAVAAAQLSWVPEQGPWLAEGQLLAGTWQRSLLPVGVPCELEVAAQQG